MDWTRERLRDGGDWLLDSDPGLVRLQTAGRTILTLAVSLLVLYLLTKATGQSVSVALLGVVIAMMSAMAVNDPDPRQQRLTMLLLPFPAAAATSLGALLAPHKVAGDIVFVAIMFAAVYARRYDGRGMALGMVAFMTYFFSLFLGATVGQLPWLIGAVVVGTACSFLMRTFVLPDRPDRVLRRTGRALWVRVDAVMEAASRALGADRNDERQQRTLARRVARLNETSLMVQSQLDDPFNDTSPWPEISGEDLTLRLFDVRLATERLANAARRASAAPEALVPRAARSELAETLEVLGSALRPGAPNEALELAAADAGRTGDAAASTEVRRVELAIGAMVRAATAAREPGRADTTDPRPASTDRPVGQPSPEPQSTETGQPRSVSAAIARLRPTTRQAIQVAVASSLAIVAGELLSSARWYWAVIAAFVIFSGTTSRGETLTKGWQRLIGTVVGVPVGALIATLVNGNTAWSLALIFVSMFGAFYLMKIAYSLMIFWITTMLALLYGLLGEFTLGVLVLRIEETAIGAGIGVLVAIFVLPTSTRTTARTAMLDFLAALSGLISAGAHSPPDGSKAPDLTAQTRDLDRSLQQLTKAAKPLTGGIVAVHGRADNRRVMRMLAASDHYARTFARSSDRVLLADTAASAPAEVGRAADAVGRNVDALADLLRRRQAVVDSASELLDAAEQATSDAAGAGGGAAPGTGAAEVGEAAPGTGAAEVGEVPPAAGAAGVAIVRSLRGIDGAIVDLAHDLGAKRRADHSDPQGDPLAAIPLSP